MCAERAGVFVGSPEDVLIKTILVADTGCIVICEGLSAIRAIAFFRFLLRCVLFAGLCWATAVRNKTTRKKSIK